jgi:hypothetical protein
MITPGRAVAPESREHEKYEHLIASTDDPQRLVTAGDKTSLKGALRICAMSEALAIDLHGMDISDQ